MLEDGLPILYASSSFAIFSSKFYWLGVKVVAASLEGFLPVSLHGVGCCSIAEATPSMPSAATVKPRFRSRRDSMSLFISLSSTSRVLALAASLLLCVNR